MTITLCIQSFDIDRSQKRSSLLINHSVTDTFKISTDFLFYVKNFYIPKNIMFYYHLKQHNKSIQLKYSKLLTGSKN